MRYESGEETCVVKEQETEVEPDGWETEEVEGDLSISAVMRHRVYW